MRQFVTFIVLTAVFSGCSSLNIFDLTKKAIDTTLKGET
jgi:hypothetical protein